MRPTCHYLRGRPASARRPRRHRPRLYAARSRGGPPRRPLAALPVRPPLLRTRADCPRRITQPRFCPSADSAEIDYRLFARCCFLRAAEGKPYASPDLRIRCRTSSNFPATRGPAAGSRKPRLPAGRRASGWRVEALHPGWHLRSGPESILGRAGPRACPRARPKRSGRFRAAPTPEGPNRVARRTTYRRTGARLR